MPETSNAVEIAATQRPLRGDADAWTPPKNTCSGNGPDFRVAAGEHATSPCVQTGPRNGKKSPATDTHLKRRRAAASIPHPLAPAEIVAILLLKLGRAPC